MADETKAEEIKEVKEVKETPRSTAEADFTKYKVINHGISCLCVVAEKFCSTARSARGEPRDRPQRTSSVPR